jgi:hypothetical protein
MTVYTVQNGATAISTSQLSLNQQFNDLQQKYPSSSEKEI